MRKVAAFLFCLLPTLCVDPAIAGGLFGDDGLIGGDVGRFLDKNLEEPVLTPWVRGATVGATTGVGEVIGGPVGGLVGEYVGKTINERAAGESPPIGRPYTYAAAPPNAGTAAPPSAGQAGSLVFRVTNSAQYQMRLRFYSEKRGVIWPNIAHSYVLTDSAQHQFNITCQVGESVCYGAFYENTGTYWGLGRDMKNGCTDCCMTCEINQKVAAWNLGD